MKSEVINNLFKEEVKYHRPLRIAHQSELAWPGQPTTQIVISGR